MNEQMDDFDCVTVILDNDEELECVILTTLEVQDQKYVALLPTDCIGDDTEDSDVIFYRMIEKNGEPDLDNIESDDEFEMVADKFDEWLDIQLFNEMDEEE